MVDTGLCIGSGVVTFTEGDAVIVYVPDLRPDESAKIPPLLFPPTLARLLPAKLTALKLFPPYPPKFGL